MGAVCYLNVSNEEREDRTMPWLEQEYVWVNGMPCVYSVKRGRLDTIHLIGGHDISLADALDKYAVVIPAVVRRD